MWLHLRRAAALALAALFMVAQSVRGDHIPSAQDGLGPLWWGVGILGLVGLAFVGSIAYVVVKLSRQENAREEGGERR